MKIYTAALIIGMVCVGCNNDLNKGVDNVAPLKRTVERYGSLIDDRIAQTLKSIDSLENRKNVYARRNLQVKVREVIRETDQTCAYFDRCQNKIIAAAGGKNIAEIKHPHDTLTVTELMMTQKSGDTVQQYIEETREIFLKMSTDSAFVSTLLPDDIQFAPGIAPAAAGDWKTRRFKNMAVITAIELFDQYKYDTKCSELVILDRILKEAEKRK